MALHSMFNLHKQAIDSISTNILYLKSKYLKELSTKMQSDHSKPTIAADSSIEDNTPRTQNDVEQDLLSICLYQEKFGQINKAFRLYEESFVYFTPKQIDMLLQAQGITGPLTDNLSKFKQIDVDKYIADIDDILKGKENEVLNKYLLLYRLKTAQIMLGLALVALALIGCITLLSANLFSVLVVSCLVGMFLSLTGYNDQNDVSRNSAGWYSLLSQLNSDNETFSQNITFSYGEDSQPSGHHSNVERALTGTRAGVSNRFFEVVIKAEAEALALVSQYMV
jgi:hypothetical protein